jgi:hypothetical protein
MVAVSFTYLPPASGGLVMGLLLLLFLVAPLFIWMRRLWHSYTPADYSRSSSLLKTLMGVGILLFVGFLFFF